MHKASAFHVLCTSTDSLAGYGGQGQVKTRFAQGTDKQGPWTVSDHVPLAWTPSVMFYTPTTRGQGELQVKHWERQERTGAEAASGCGAEGVRWWGLKWEIQRMASLKDGA